MTLKMADDGIKEKLSQARTAWNSVKLRLHLYKSNTTPTNASILSDFTECDFAGYAAQDISTWSVPTVAAHVATMTAAANLFTRSTTGASQNIYGYYVTDSTNATLEWAERDPNAPIVLTVAGDSYQVTAALTDQDLST